MLHAFGDLGALAAVDAGSARARRAPWPRRAACASSCAPFQAAHRRRRSRYPAGDFAERLRGARGDARRGPADALRRARRRRRLRHALQPGEPSPTHLQAASDGCSPSSATSRRAASPTACSSTCGASSAAGRRRTAPAPTTARRGWDSDRHARAGQMVGEFPGLATLDAEGNLRSTSDFRGALLRAARAVARRRRRADHPRRRSFTRARRSSSREAARRADAGGGGARRARCRRSTRARKNPVPLKKLCKRKPSKLTGRKQRKRCKKSPRAADAEQPDHPTAHRPGAPVVPPVTDPAPTDPGTTDPGSTPAPLGNGSACARRSSSSRCRAPSWRRATRWVGELQNAGEDPHDLRIAPRAPARRSSASPRCFPGTRIARRRSSRRAATSSGARSRITKRSE